ncbi:MAG: MarC family protein [Verrucomicrobiota bacterium]|nr:MarC family protein [Verrucomicrobiota bacterium]
MVEFLTHIFQVFSKFFFLLAPFFVLAIFLSLTPDDTQLRRKLALRVAIAVLVACFCILFFGNTMFRVFGITLDSFKIGAGALLFLTSVDVVRGKPPASRDVGEQEVTIVPLAIPITVGPATTGAIMILGAESKANGGMTTGCIGLALAVVSLGIILYLGSEIKAVMKAQGILVMSKIMGVVISALAAQMIFTGIKGVLQ